MKDLKYLIAYLLPLAAFLGFYFKGIWSPAGIYLAFIIIPVFEQVLPKSAKNLSPEEEENKVKSFFFDLLLYLNLPILFGLLIYYLNIIHSASLTTFESVGLTLNMGLVLGTVGINVAHELGHRNNQWEVWIAQALLLPNLYMHFTIEHNRGHHKNIGTPEDPATAREGESIYAFWVRSVTGSYLNAWKLEKQRLQRSNKAVFSHHNAMIRITIIQLLYLLVIALFWSWTVAGFAVGAAVVGFLLLETVNYIEHYGLKRKRTNSGRYEKVTPRHSWNSDHELGRIFLYELTRHADHHYKANRKYQVLRHLDNSPQLPYGYPASMLLSLVPPLWFYLIREELNEWKGKLVKT